MLQFLITFILLAIVSSFLIISFYELTRHYVVIQPDGKERVEGLVLKFWSQWIEKVKTIERVYYSGEPLEYKFNELKKILPNIGNKLSIVNSEQALELNEGKELSKEEIDKIESALICKVKNIENTPLSKFLFLYLEEPIYYIPDIIRKPLSSCIKCMATPFGSLIWLTVNLNYDFFSWANHKLFCFFVFYFVFIVTLSRLNDYLYKKIF